MLTVIAAVCHESGPASCSCRYLVNASATSTYAVAGRTCHSCPNAKWIVSESLSDVYVDCVSVAEVILNESGRVVGSRCRVSANATSCDRRAVFDNRISWCRL